MNTLIGDIGNTNTKICLIDDKTFKIRKMHANLVKIRQCKGFYFGMGLIELSMKNMFLHKYIYRVSYVWKFYDQFFNDILSIIIKTFSKYVGPNWMLHSLKWRPVQNKKSNQFFSPQLEIHFLTFSMKMSIFRTYLGNIH